MSRVLPLALLALLAAACAVPLGPGFHVEKELLEVRFVSGSPPHLEVRATFTLKNAGNTPLDALDISLPDKNYFGLQNLRITVDGAAISPQSFAGSPAPAPAGAPDLGSASTVRVPLTSPWPHKSLLSLVIAYDLTRPLNAGGGTGAAVSAFYLPTSEWYPFPRAPKGLFAQGDSPPGRFDFSVIVPQDFLVHAAGHPRGKKRRAAESEYRFRIAADDFFPFVVAGRYHEQKFADSSGTVIFWTFQPLPEDQVRRAGPRLAATVSKLEKLFGPIYPGAHKQPMRIIELPFWSGQEVADPALGVAMVHAPAAALLSPEAFLHGIAGEDFVSQAEFTWASTWFQHISDSRPAPDHSLGFAFIPYVAMISELARRGEPARVHYIASFLLSYDMYTADVREKPVALLNSDDNGKQQEIAWNKAGLFLIALEDELGRETVHRALRRMIQSLRGREYGYSDLRAALEAETGKDLGEFFRLWLNQPGIPASFRARYADQKSLEQK
jgi:hypothetical protein